MINKKQNYLKQIGKEYGYKYRDETLFKVEGKLFFDIWFGFNKNGNHCIKLYYKWYDFDSLFWDITEMEEHKKAPLSSHIFLCWSLNTKEVYEIETNNNFKLDDKNIIPYIEKIIKKATKLSLEIDTLEKNIEYLKINENRISLKYSILYDIYKEELLTYILSGDIENAMKIINERLLLKDDGGFSSRFGGFYYMAKKYLHKKDKPYFSNYEISNYEISKYKLVNLNILVNFLESGYIEDKKVYEIENIVDFFIKKENKELMNLIVVKFNDFYKKRFFYLLTRKSEILIKKDIDGANMFDD